MVAACHQDLLQHTVALTCCDITSAVAIQVPDVTDDLVLSSAYGALSIVSVPLKLRQLGEVVLTLSSSLCS